MAELRDVVGYLCDRYPKPEHLSKARLTKLVYMADWRSSIVLGKQLTPIRWVFNHYGPYVDDVVQLARLDTAFEVETEQNVYGGLKETIRLRTPFKFTSLGQDDKSVLDFVIASTSARYYDDFLRLVYSTYPIVTQPRFAQLDLPALAAEYRDQKGLFTAPTAQGGGVTTRTRASS